MIRVRLLSEPNDHYPYGEVLDSSGNVIGDADSYTYGGGAFAVHTRNFAGWVPMREVVYVVAS